MTDIGEHCKAIGPRFQAPTRRLLPILIAGIASTVLLATSCAKPAATTTSTPPTTTAAAPVTTSPLASTLTPTSEKPVYGGVISVAQSADILYFDEYNTMQPVTFGLTQEELQTGDWTKGPAGTNDAEWTHTGTNRVELRSNQLAESWESPAVGQLVYHIRKGVHWALNPNSEASRLVNGRELNADDVVFSLKRLCTESRAYIRTAYPSMALSAEIAAPDKSTVTIKVPASEFSNAISLFPELMHIYPPEVIQKYGNMADWHNSVGTGPFMLTDFVGGSSATFVRNPNYWDKDPIGAGKGNQLPYLDGIKMPIIVDVSTRQAALRTAKIDHGGTFETIEDADAVTKNAPQLKSKKVLGHTGWEIGMRIYKQDLPYKDIRVRKALMMATDFNALKDQLYKGDAEIQSWPNTYQREYKNIFLPLNEAPAAVQELYKYNPEKAKSLLADAGYPNGFKAKIIAPSTPVSAIDFLSVVKAMWAKVGVELQIDAREASVFSSLYQAMAYDDMILGTSAGAIGRYYSCNSFSTPSYFNTSQVDDPKVKQAALQFADIFNTMDWPKLDSEYKKLLPYVLEQAWVIPRPQPYSYYLWWPWIKNYHGEGSVGYTNTWNWTRFAWLDRNAKDDITKNR